MKDVRSGDRRRRPGPVDGDSYDGVGCSWNVHSSNSDPDLHPSYLDFPESGDCTGRGGDTRMSRLCPTLTGRSLVLKCLQVTVTTPLSGSCLGITVGSGHPEVGHADTAVTSAVVTNGAYTEPLLRGTRPTPGI